MAKKIHMSARGKVVDFDAMQAQAPKTIAVGNAGYNARGDLVGKGGRIEKTAEEISRRTRALHQSESHKARNVSIKDNIDDLRSKRNNWVNPGISDLDPNESLDISEAVKIIDDEKKGNVKKDQPKKTLSTTNKREISDED